MKGRNTLLLLLAVTVLALLGRWYVGRKHAEYQDAKASFPNKAVQVAENVGDLGARLENLSVSDQEQDFQTHFAAQAGVAQMGLVTVKTQDRDQRGYLDKVFTIEFPDRAAQFNRNQLSVFLYNGETQKPRMRATRFSVRAGSTEGGAVRRVATGSDREDIWRVEAVEFTQRTPTKAETPR